MSIEGERERERGWARIYRLGAGRESKERKFREMNKREINTSAGERGHLSIGFNRGPLPLESVSGGGNGTLAMGMS